MMMKYKGNGCHSLRNKSFISKTSLRYRRPAVCQKSRILPKLILARPLIRWNIWKDKPVNGAPSVMDGASRKTSMEIEQATIDQIWG